MPLPPDPNAASNLRPRDGLRRIATAASRHTDLALALLLVAIVALFVLPLPTPLMDLLIASNLAISIVLLIVAMYVPSSLSLSTFPSLLLFTTLFRLALNIASTKLILLHANAGHIIDTFGRLIVEHSVVVGAVVFMIIAIVQFIVIAKGSERVAEVAARFALDAMPGKQMSIDAELRSGMLSALQAQQKRRALEQESQFHGAMDGAMKFVKGDAIAGILIALVNILAGVAVGTLMHGMGIGQALERYAILTVGDGMVSQIPSLLVSIAAGVVITRVSSTDDRGSPPLAAQIAAQVTAHPRALAIAAVTISAFLLVPGFPKWAFGFWALALAGAGWVTYDVHRRGHAPAWISHHEARAIDEESSTDAITYPIALRLAAPLHAHIDARRFDRAMVQARRRAEQELGPVYPHLQLVYSPTMSGNAYEVLVQDVPVSRGELQPGRRLLRVDVGGMSAVPDDATVGEPFGPFARVIWVDAAQRKLPALDLEEVLVAHVDSVARRHAPRLIGLQDVQRLLHWMQTQVPDLATEVVRTVPAQRVAETLRRLLQEGVPVRNLRAIFESLVRWAPKEEDGIALTELVRTDLGAYITSRHVGADRRLNAVLFDSALLDRIVAAIERSPRGNLLLLSPQVRESILDQLGACLAQAPAGVVVVVSTDVRRYVRLLVEPRFAQLTVLAYQELDEDVQLHAVGWIHDTAETPALAA